MEFPAVLGVFQNSEIIDGLKARVKLGNVPEEP